MKAQELRLGNLGSTKYDGVLLTGKVISISDGRIVMDLETNDKDYVECHISPFDFKPIPLTEEWLVKLGFTEATDEYGGYLSPEMNGGGRIRVNKNQWYSHVNYVELKHVHQLQNLYYALTQTEL